MGTSVSGKVIDKIVSAGVATWFRQNGFNRKGRSFFRWQDELVLTAIVDAMTFNTPEKAHFRVFLGIEWPFLYKAYTGLELRANPAIAPTFIEAGLNRFSEPRGGTWWPADQNTDANEVAALVVTALETHAHQFWKRYSDLDRVLRELKVGIGVPVSAAPAYPALLVRAGRPAEARREIAELARRRPDSRAYFKVFAERLGLRDYET